MLGGQSEIEWSEPTTNPFAEKDHRQDQGCNSQTDKTARHEHVLQSIDLNPWTDSKGYSDGECITDECHRRERVSGYLYVQGLVCDFV